MPIYEITTDKIVALPQTTFSETRLLERKDLQRLLRDQIEIVAPDLLVIAEEFCEWADSKRRVDLLAVDRSANLVVSELKRTEDGGHMDLQSLRYAAMVSTMTFERAVGIYSQYQEIDEEEAQSRLVEFLRWDDPAAESFAPDVRIILVSAEFSQELTTAVLWLNKRDLDIRCVRLRPYRDGSRVLLDVSQVIPLPEEAAYQVRLKEKEEETRRAGRKWDRSSFLAALQASDCDPRLAERILSWADRQRIYVRWGQGRESGSFACVLRTRPDDVKYPVLVVRAEGTVVTWADRLRAKPALSRGDALERFLSAIRAIPGVELRGDPAKRPRFDLSALSAPHAMERLEAALTELVESVRAWHRDHSLAEPDRDEGLMRREYE